MYEDHYRVLDDPFRFTPDEHSPYQHHSYLSGVAFLQHVLDHSRKVLILIYGLAGVGKSTLVNDILRRQKTDRVKKATLTASHVNSHGLPYAVAQGFKLDVSIPEDTLLQDVIQYIAEQSEQGRHTLLIIEDAHDLSSESLNVLGQLLRVVWENRYKMKIFLVGSPKLDQLLYQTRNDVLQKKIVIGWNQHGMSESEIGGYVKHRVRSVGGRDLSFEDIVWRTLSDFSDGIPRRINRICNKMFLNGFIEKKLAFTNADVMDAIRQLDNEGLLEVKKSFATLHGLVGTTHTHLEDQVDLDIDAFTRGYTDPKQLKPFMPALEDDNKACTDNADIPLLDQRESPSPLNDIDKLPPMPGMMATDFDHTDTSIDTNFDHREYFPLDDTESRFKQPQIIMLMLVLLTVIAVIIGLSINSSSEKSDHENSLGQTTQSNETISQNQQDAELAGKPQTEADDLPQRGFIEPEPKAAIEEQNTAQIPTEQDTVATIEEETPDARDTSINTSEDKSPPLVDDNKTRIETTKKPGDEEIDESGYQEELEYQKQAKVESAQEQSTVTKEPDNTDENIQANTKVPLEITPRYTQEQLIGMLMSGDWTQSGGLPAILLPSDRNQCTQNRRDIFCRATETLKTTTDKALVRKTGAMIHQFSGQGNFSISYRRTFAGQQGSLKENRMNCQFVNKSQINCYENGTLIRFVRRFKLEG